MNPAENDSEQPCQLACFGRLRLSVHDSPRACVPTISHEMQERELIWLVGTGMIG
jgi:hypothetical protein